MDSERDRRAEAVADAAEATGTVSGSSAGYDPEPVKFQEDEAVVSVVGQGLVVLA